VALPLEFQQIANRLDMVNVERNPFSALPTQWCSRWEPRDKYITAFSNGYTGAEVQQWMAEQAQFYEAANTEWAASRESHLDCTMGLPEFKDGVQERMGHEWQEGMAGALALLYCRCKELGYVPRYDQITEDEKASMARQTAAVKEMRVVRSANVAALQAGHEMRLEAAYEMALPARMERAAEHQKQAKKRNAEVEVAEMRDLLAECQERAPKQKNLGNMTVESQRALEYAQCRSLAAQTNEANAVLIHERALEKGRLAKAKAAAALEWARQKAELDEKREQHEALRREVESEERTAAGDGPAKKGAQTRRALHAHVHLPPAKHPAARK
jgi:hypothetical protein